MKLRILGLLPLALIGISGYATAQTLVGSTTDPTGIDGLVVDGTTYNVTFSTTTFNPPFPPFSNGNLDAAADLADALTHLGVTRLAGVAPVECAPDDTGCQAEAILFVAVDVLAAACANVPASQSPLACIGHEWVTTNQFSTTLGPIKLNGRIIGYGEAADFTTVPEPGTLSLLGLGLAGIGFIRRRKS